MTNVVVLLLKVLIWNLAEAMVQSSDGNISAAMAIDNSVLIKEPI